MVVTGSDTQGRDRHNSKQKDADAAFEACGGKSCPPADRTKVDALDSDAATSKTLALTSFVVGGAGLATGVTLLVLSGKQKSEPAARLAPRVQPWIGYRSLGLSGVFEAKAVALRPPRTGGEPPQTPFGGVDPPRGSP